MKELKRHITLRLTLLYSLLLICFYASAQQIEDKGIGTGNKRGIYLGNPLHFNGLRLTLISMNKYYNAPCVINGASVGIILWDSINNGASLGVVANRANHGSGIAIGAVACARKKMNGVMMGGMWSVSDKTNGVQIGITNICNRNLNGLAIGGTITNSDIDSNRLIINGIEIASLADTKQLNGVGLVIIHLEAKDINGLAVSAYVKSEQQTGVTIGLLNKTKKLHGVQLGLLNYAANNPKGLRWLPVINAHLGKA